MSILERLGIKVESCPFCGGYASTELIQTPNIYHLDIVEVCIVCCVCGAKSRSEFVESKGYEDFALANAVKKASENWNRRKEP